MASLADLADGLAAARFMQLNIRDGQQHSPAFMLADRAARLILENARAGGVLA